MKTNKQNKMETTIIHGPAGSGKTTLARKLTQGKKCIATTEKDLQNFKLVSGHRVADYIIIDDVVNVNELMGSSFFKALPEKLSFKRQIIITQQLPKTECLKKLDYTHIISPLDISNAPNCK
jgi:adenylate kinase family enzyme